VDNVPLLAARQGAIEATMSRYIGLSRIVLTGLRGPINVGGWLVTDTMLSDQCCGLQSEDI